MACRKNRAKLLQKKTKKSGNQPLFISSCDQSLPDLRRVMPIRCHPRIHFLGGVGHTQFVGFAPPTQTLGWQISTFSVFSLPGFIYLTCLVL